MKDIDRMIDESLSAEERDLLRRIGDEPAYMNQVLAIFDGRTGWVSVVMMIAQTALFVGGAWAAWNFFQAEDALDALRWGLPSAVLLLMSLIIKLSLWPTLQANRVLRELKRLELQVVRHGGA
ncbi:MAG: hypothetical protein Q8J89_08085 [Caulobacter sp.]|nr:hypothetical protein [Caulobacter sp.]